MYTLKDWGRLVGALSVPQRQTRDVEASLECLTSLWNDDAEYCATLSSLDALGHAIGNLLNQPTQNEAGFYEGKVMIFFYGACFIFLKILKCTVRSSWKRMHTVSQPTSV